MNCLLRQTILLALTVALAATSTSKALALLDSEPLVLVSYEQSLADPTSGLSLADVSAMLAKPIGCEMNSLLPISEAFTTAGAEPSSTTLGFRLSAFSDRAGAAKVSRPLLSVELWLSLVAGLGFGSLVAFRSFCFQNVGVGKLLALAGMAGVLVLAAWGSAIRSGEAESAMRLAKNPMAVSATLSAILDPTSER